MSEAGAEVFRRVRTILARRFRRPRSADIKVLTLLMFLALLTSLIALLLLPAVSVAMPLSAGDRVQVTVEAGEEFSGRYQIDVQGRIQMPYAGAITLAGQEPEVAAATISDRLVGAALFRRSFVRTSVVVIHWAPIDVRISGAVFLPGAHMVNTLQPKDVAADRREDLPGAGLPQRKLSDALRTAGGVTPWADIAHVAVRRAGQTRLYNLWGLVVGETGEDPALQSGDEVLVPVLNEVQAALARPSAITPPGIKIFASNLIQPSQSNASATVSGGQLSLAYGSRFSQAAVAANCVGGVSATNAGRSAVLIRTDRLTGQTTTWDESVENLARQNSEARNPILMEGDAIACYDSGVTNLRDVFRTIADILLPYTLLQKGRR